MPPPGADQKASVSRRQAGPASDALVLRAGPRGSACRSGWRLTRPRLRPALRGLGQARSGCASCVRHCVCCAFSSRRPSAAPAQCASSRTLCCAGLQQDCSLAAPASSGRPMGKARTMDRSAKLPSLCLRHARAESARGSQILRAPVVDVWYGCTFGRDCTSCPVKPIRAACLLSHLGVYVKGHSGHEGVDAAVVRYACAVRNISCEILCTDKGRDRR
eukprot:scaffold1827_cov421-Prasinococcus_capsulatus_cf.AAC.31